MLDSGCTRHSSNCPKYFVNFTEENDSVKICIKDAIQSMGFVNVKSDFVVNVVSPRLVLKDVSYIPDITYNLTSISAAQIYWFCDVVNNNKNLTTKRNHCVCP